MHTSGTAPTRRTQDRLIWQSFQHHSRTFSLAARLLPPAVQLPVATVYLFCRTVDNLADQYVLEVGPELALDALYRTHRKLDYTLAGHPPADMLWQRLAEVHEAYNLPRGALYELLGGAAWDLEERPILQHGDLITYSNLVAGSVGAMMLPFLVPTKAERKALEAPARALGIAMQITNILRDVGEDLRQLGRVYLPAEELAEHGLSRADLLHPGLPPSYPALLESLMETAETYYEEGLASLPALPRQARLGIRCAGRMYREILNEVRARHYDNLSRRAYVSLPRKAQVMLFDGYAHRKALLQASYTQLA